MGNWEYLPPKPVGQMKAETTGYASRKHCWMKWKDWTRSAKNVSILEGLGSFS